MTEHPRDAASREQRRAADPARLGVRRRLGRLGQDQAADRPAAAADAGRRRPARIQCLTFTKAAAAEMAVRLQRTLGALGHAADAALDAELRPSGDRRRAPPAASGARALFAARAGPARRHAHRHHPRLLPVAAAPLPAGGRAVAAFPAGGRARRRRRAAEAREDDARGGARRASCTRAMRLLAGLASGGAVRPAGRGLAGRAAAADVLAAALGGRTRWRRAAPRARRRCGGRGGTASPTPCAGRTRPRLRDARCVVAGRARLAKRSRKRRARMLDWLGAGRRHGACRELGRTGAREFLRDGGEPRARRRASSTSKLRQGAAGTGRGDAGRAGAHRGRSRTTAAALQVAALSAALVALAAPVLRAYAARKDAPALLDYDDLIGRAVEPAGRSRRRLGAVQAGRRPRPPAAGRGAGHRARAMAHRPRADRGVLRRRRARATARRTVFAVGDRKQSIYSFQGADADEFDRGAQPAAPARARRPAGTGARCRWTCRSARPRRCWPWSMRCSPIRSPPPGVVGARRRCATMPTAPGMPARSNCGRWRRGPTSRTPDPGRCRSATSGQRSAPQRLAERAGRLDRTRNQRRGAAGKPGPSAAAGRRAGAGAAAQRLRPRAGAGAEGARRAGGRARPAGADRAAGGAGPDGAGRRAAAAAGRSDASPAC